jgi:hypothetical protein
MLGNKSHPSNLTACDILDRTFTATAMANVSVQIAAVVADTAAVVAVNHELASPTEKAVVLDPLQEDAVVDIHRRWQRERAQAMLLATCCCTRPLPHTPDYTPEDASDDSTFAHGAWSEAEFTIYTRTRLRARERARRFEQLMAFSEDGTGFEQFGVIVVPNAYPQARVREPDFLYSIFTRMPCVLPAVLGNKSHPSSLTACDILDQHVAWRCCICHCHAVPCVADGTIWPHAVRDHDAGRVLIINDDDSATRCP